MTSHFSSFSDFNSFADEVLVEAAAQQRAEQCYSVDLRLILARLNIDPFDGWNEQLIPFLEGRGWVDDDSTMADRRLRVIGAGFAQVESIKEQRKPKSLPDRLASDRTQKLLNVGAFGTSLISLIVAIIALILAGK